VGADHYKFYTTIDAMEPMFPEDRSGELEYLATVLMMRASALSESLHPLTRKAIADLLRPMNTYYSNVIEGHDTHPLDIEKALAANFLKNKRQAALQLEAKAHINLHKLIAERFDLKSENPYKKEFICFLHKEFYRHLPGEFLHAERIDGTSVMVIPGQIRDSEVSVGRHVGPYSKSLSAFLDRFEEYYDPTSNNNKSKIKRIISIAAAHHRLAWIHPFVDGNGRVVRLFTDACFMSEDLHASGLWSMSRGLARHEAAYKFALSAADAGNMNDYDGRGNLSNRELVNFCNFFLSTAIDQVEFMSRMLDIDHMIACIHRFVDLMVAHDKLKKEAAGLLETVFLKGKISKSEAMRITGRSDKTTKLIADSLLEMGLLKLENETKFSDYLVNYPIGFSTVIISGLYPRDKEIDILSRIIS